MMTKKAVRILYNIIRLWKQGCQVRDAEKRVEKQKILHKNELTSELLKQGPYRKHTIHHEEKHAEGSVARGGKEYFLTACSSFSTLSSTPSLWKSVRTL